MSTRRASKKRRTKLFNLLSPKSASQIAIEIERDNTALYSMLLLFGAALVYFVLFAIDAFFVQSSLRTAEANVAELTQVTSAYSAIRASYGELYVKSESLKPVLSKQIDADKIFSIGTQLTAGISGASVIEYSRERSGDFVFVLSTSSFDDVADVVANVVDITGVSNFFVRQSTVIADTNAIRTVVSLTIDVG